MVYSRKDCRPRQRPLTAGVLEYVAAAGKTGAPAGYVPWAGTLMLLGCGCSYLDWEAGRIRIDDKDRWRSVLGELRRHSVSGGFVWKLPWHEWTPELMLRELDGGGAKHIEIAYYMSRDKALAERSSIAVAPAGPVFPAQPTCAYILRRTKYIEESARLLRHLLKPQAPTAAHGRAAWLLPPPRGAGGERLPRPARRDGQA